MEKYIRGGLGVHLIVPEETFSEMKDLYYDFLLDVYKNIRNKGKINFAERFKSYIEYLEYNVKRNPKSYQGITVMKFKLLAQEHVGTGVYHSERRFSIPYNLLSLKKEVETVTSKRCGMCGAEKPLTEYKRFITRDTSSVNCKDCLQYTKAIKAAQGKRA